jgi:hypothetical protein
MYSLHTMDMVDITQKVKIQSTELKKVNKPKVQSEDASIPLVREKNAMTLGGGGSRGRKEHGLVRGGKGNMIRYLGRNQERSPEVQ